MNSSKPNIDSPTPARGSRPQATSVFCRDWLSRVGIASRESDLTVIGTAVAKHFQFDHFLLGIRVPISGNPTQLIWNNLPPAWLKKYQQERPIEEDPVVMRVYRTTVPFFWDEIVTSPIRMQAVLKISTEFGLVHGITIPLHAVPLGAQGVDTVSTGLFSLSRHVPIPGERELRELLAREVSLFALLMQELALSTQTIPENHIGTSVPRLTSREREVLMWAAKGETAAGIGKRLGIAPSTVAYHIDHSCKKLGVDSRRAAVGKALLLGEIRREE